MTSLEERIEKEVAALGHLTRDDLVDRWVKAYGCSPPKGVKRGLIERAAAWHLQAKHFGGLSAAARKAIREAAKQHRIAAADSRQPHHRAADVMDAKPIALLASPPASRDISVVARPDLRSGTRLVREWNGRTHVVDVGEVGFVFDGKTYGSLSAIAKRITGAHWSGPRFFGL